MKQVKLRYYQLFLFVILFISNTKAAVFQWSVPVKDTISTETNAHPQAFLWIPDNCKNVKAVLLGQHNMSEEDLFGRPKFREGLSKLGIAQIWVTPAFDMIFDFHLGAGNLVENMLKDLAEKSGYTELEYAPIIPIGHSACASYPWNLAAWNPGRTLCVISEHGDAPLSNLTGSGRPNPNWENRTIEGIPGVMIEGEYEWWEKRVQPALDYKIAHPKAPVSFLCDAGHGHFDVSDELVDYILLFIKKAVKYRLTKKQNNDKTPLLIPINPKDGWLKERWKKDTKPIFEAAPYKQYQGDKKEAFWYFDKEMAQATEAYYQRVRSKKDQYIGITQNGQLQNFNIKSHARISGQFHPQSDGLTFCMNAIFTDTLRQIKATEHAPGNPVISKICGPVEQVDDTTFTVRFFRMGMNNPKRTGDIWLLASHPGNDEYKSTVQQFNMRIPLRNKEGIEQEINFQLTDSVVSLSALKKRGDSIKLDATSSSGMPVYFYVKEGPVWLKENKLEITKIPPRTKFPVKVTVVAWQYGRSIEPKVQTAKPVERIFYIVN